MEEGGGPREGEEIDVVSLGPPTGSQPTKKVRINYEDMGSEELVEEMRRRKKKPGRMKREQMIEFLVKENKCQGRITWGKEDVKGCYAKGDLLKGETEVEGEDKDTQESTREAEEDDWEDMNPRGEDKPTGSETAGEAKPKTRARGKPKIVHSPGRPRGRERRGYWVARRENQLQREGRLTVRTDSNSNFSGERDTNQGLNAAREDPGNCPRS